jgi:hypothetical protein
MRKISLALAAASSVLFVVAPSAPQAEILGGGNKPERTLSCSRNQSPYCDVSCVTTAGQSLFVFDRVSTIYVTEFAGNHTLLEVKRTAPDEIVSVLVGDISHCTFNGLLDPTIRER